MAGSPNDELRLTTFYAINKRTELQGKPVDVSDALKRVRRISGELNAWVNLQIKCPTVECTSWKHFEFRYFQPQKSPSDAIRELLAGRDGLVRKLSDTSKDDIVIKRLKEPNPIVSADDVQELTQIV